MSTLDDADLKAIKGLIEVTIDEKIEEKGLVTKDDISHLPTKNEFYEETSKILKRLDDLEEGMDVLSHQVSGHEDRITNLETQVQSTAD